MVATAGPIGLFFLTERQVRVFRAHVEGRVVVVLFRECIDDASFEGLVICDD